MWKKFYFIYLSILGHALLFALFCFHSQNGELFYNSPTFVENKGHKLKIYSVKFETKYRDISSSQKIREKKRKKKNVNTHLVNKENRAATKNNSWWTPAPIYPQSAINEKRQGEVIIEFVCDNLGKVSNTKIVQSSGFSDLDQSALLSVLAWRLNPLQKGQIPIRFSLEESALPDT